MLVRALRTASLVAFTVMLLSAAVPLSAATTFPFALDINQGQEEEPAASIFDKYVGVLGGCSLGARLDNLAIELQNSPETQGYILIYTGKYDLPQSVLAYKERAYHYLVNTRGVDAARLVFVDAGYRQELTTEFWIAPNGAPAPEPTATINPKEELDQAFKFDEDNISVASDSDYIVEDFEPVIEVADETATDEANVEPPTEDQMIAEGATEETAETQEEAVESTEEAVDADMWWTSAAYTRALNLEPKARGHIIFYADRKDANFSKVQAVVEQAMRQMAEKYHVKTERLTAVFGGYRQSPTAELWIVPVNVSAPIPTPQPEEEKQEEEKAAQP